MRAKTWTRQDPEYKKALITTADKYGITEDKVERIILNYLSKCKRMIAFGHKVQLPGIIYIATHICQSKQMRKKMCYAQFKKHYGKKEYFIKYIAKKKNVNK